MVFSPPKMSPHRKEVKFMKYDKPEVTLLSSAVDAIQTTQMKDVPTKPDLGQVFHTNAAYEADE
jgi:hypothetical protein